MVLGGVVHQGSAKADSLWPDGVYHNFTGATLPLPVNTTWLHACSVVPSVTATFGAASGWIMAAKDSLDYVQVGWYASTENVRPYVEWNVGGNDTQLFQELPLHAGDQVCFALSNDLGTGIWHEWFMLPDGRWEMLASENAGFWSTESACELYLERVYPPGYAAPEVQPFLFSQIWFDYFSTMSYKNTVETIQDIGVYPS